jgi:hypothetical protein
VPILWALISALWIGISSAAPELIWQGMKIALAHPSWADLVSALLIGLVLAFFIEPVMEQAREWLHRPGEPRPVASRSHNALFGAVLSFAFAIISVLLHDAMIALIAGEGPRHSDESALTAGISLTAAWALVPIAVTLAWHGGGADRRLAVPLGVLAAVSPVIAGWLFSWPPATIIITEVPTLLFLPVGYRELRRPPREAAFVRCAIRVAIIAAIWLPIARAFDALSGHPGEFYGWTDFLVDARFYFGWAVGLALVPLPVDRASHADDATP